MSEPLDSMRAAVLQEVIRGGPPEQLGGRILAIIDAARAASTPEAGLTAERLARMLADDDQTDPPMWDLLSEHVRGQFRRRAQRILDREGAALRGTQVEGGERLREAAKRYLTAERALDVNRHAGDPTELLIERGTARQALGAALLSSLTEDPTP